MPKVQKIEGSKEECEYYPCHFKGQDCTWCFCPLYPCGDFSKGGKFVISKTTGKKVWSCKNCFWIHDPKVARKIVKDFR